MAHNRRSGRSGSRLRARVLLAAGALLTLTTGSVVSAQAATVPSAWAQNNGNAAASRSNSNETTLSTATVARLTRRRGLAVAAAQGDNPCEYAGIDVAAASATVDYVEGDGHLSARDAATGQIRWSVTPDRYFETRYTSIAVAHGLVIVGGLDCISQSDPNGVLFAFDAATGRRVWTAGVGSALDSMVVSGSYLVETGSSIGSGQVISVRRVGTGAVVWQQVGADCADYGATPLVVVDQRVVTHRCDADTGAPSLTAYRLTSGALSWTRAIDWPIERADSGAFGTRHLLVKDDNGYVLDLDPVTGVTQYYLAAATSVLAIDASRVYAKCGSGSVCAFAVGSGAALWSTADSSGLAAEANGVLYLGDGRVLDAGTGAGLARLFTAGSASILFVAGGRVGAATSARTLALYGLAGS